MDDKAPPAIMGQQDLNRAQTSSHESGHESGSKEMNYGHVSGDLGHTMTLEEHQVAQAAARFGYGPLAHVRQQGGNFYRAFGGELQPGLMPAASIQQRKFGNPAPLGLCGFALTTFVLSLVNLQTRGVTAPNLVVASAYAYGGLVQLLAGMWEMAVGNTFGATALSSYGGFWLTYAIILTPGGFGIVDAIQTANGNSGLQNAQGFWLIGWFIFTTIMCLLTLRSTVAFFTLFFMLDLTFLLLAIGHFIQTEDGNPTASIIKTAGVFGLLTSFAAWYNAFAGIADDSNSFFIAPVSHFPWSATPSRRKGEKTEKEQV